MILSWHAPDGEAGHGYATVGKRLYTELKRFGMTMLPADAFGWDALIIVNPPNATYMLGPNLRPDIVLHAMTETNILPSSWVEILNRVGLVWVPSQFVERIFRENGVRTPMMRVGYGFEGTPKERISSDHFRVLAWGDNLHSRKNMLLAIKAFIAADLPDASLELKLNIGADLQDMCWNDGVHTYDNIIIRHVTWGRERLTAWLESGDIGVYLSGGEGYGLMPGEMMKTGLPMISVRHTGLEEYLTPDIILEVPSTEQSSFFFNKRFHVTEATEFKPDFDALVEQLRYAAAHRKQIAHLGMRGACHLESYTWDNVGKKAYDFLVHHYRT